VGTRLFQIFRREGKHALQAMIEQYFAEDTFLEIGDGCVFTSLHRHAACRAFRAKNWARLLVGHRHNRYFVEGDDASVIYQNL
jgi:hypothetical protein